MKTSPKLADDTESIPYVLKTFGVPVAHVAYFRVQILGTRKVNQKEVFPVRWTAIRTRDIVDDILPGNW